LLPDAGDPARSFLKEQLGDRRRRHHCAMWRRTQWFV